MYHDYNPHETREEYVERKTRADREFNRLIAKDKAGRRKRVRIMRARQQRRARHAYRG